ncbi:4-diphosphocytidyl-2-C-methyl-D-erythritol kinase, chloroplastic/chromoplastic isoform X2 [Syzygium oleosum]|uniref:4-diphosphocytidyl-2-C-methyl-D-erythritol kinase, chloroplastic/chromoplastic isoform X2 n=1 Tax=Syzygium oleosum TaxID=219896 RepID=UPI0024B96095|nr:4-diphosphocytidyl-2-C-methyl-D-erythritol kinase, chloroplastic/chromoplastic isoform X2 [Syzygium oleosum]
MMMMAAAAATTVASPPPCSFLRCNRVVFPPRGFSQSSGVRPPPARYGSSSTCLRRSAPIRAMVSEPTAGKQQQLEIVYDPDERINQLADEVDKQAPLSRLTLFSPCKVNVFLRITRKREDGYHDLASLFHVISLGDIIKFSLSPSQKDQLSTNVPGVPLDDKNLIIKALNLYRKKTGSNKFFWVHLDKKVPTGAGLGGGSSNAATALWAANQFNSCVATEKELQEWSGEIGSDIPFFFSHGAAYCTGREAPAFEVLPSLKRLKQRIMAAGRGQYDAVFMSGSGSTIVGVGSPDPPLFVYDEEEYKDVFLSEANFITRESNQWYGEPASSTATSACGSRPGFSSLP